MVVESDIEADRHNGGVNTGRSPADAKDAAAAHGKSTQKRPPGIAKKDQTVKPKAPGLPAQAGGTLHEVTEAAKAAARRGTPNKLKYDFPQTTKVLTHSGYTLVQMGTPISKASAASADQVARIGSNIGSKVGTAIAESTVVTAIAESAMVNRARGLTSAWGGAIQRVTLRLK